MSKQEDMYELISSYEKSGLSQSKFCKQANIKVAKFSYWRKKWLAENDELPLKVFLPLFRNNLLCNLFLSNY